MSLFSDLRPDYARSQVIKDALVPFRATYDFTPANTISGVVAIPSNRNFLSLLDIQISFPISNRTIYYSVQMINEDEKSDRLNSQVDPVTITSPIGEVLAPRFYRLYPAAGYTGTVTYFRRPAKPVFSYSVISDRVIVYNDALSTNLEWPEDWQNMVLIKALSSIGINLTSQEVSQYAELKSKSNFENVNRV